MLPTTAILTSGGKTVTNQRIEAAQGTRITILCGGDNYSNWKKGNENIPTSRSAEVAQVKSSNVSFLTINSLTPANTGVYECHIGASTIETVTIGEFKRIVKLYLHRHRDKKLYSINFQTLTYEIVTIIADSSKPTLAS